jgi:hypothetical protein
VRGMPPIRLSTIGCPFAIGVKAECSELLGNSGAAIKLLPVRVEPSPVKRRSYQTNEPRRALFTSSWVRAGS